METQVILIDYENVQAIDLTPLLKRDVLIKVLHNESQKFSSAFTNMALEIGKDKLELIQIKGTGKNALDFHIAYILGKLSKEIEDPSFHIISKDQGFKPLVEYIKQKEKKACVLESSITVPAPKAVAARPAHDWYSLVKESLGKSKGRNPKKKKTLRNQIINICHKKISEEEADKIILKLEENHVIECKNESVTYRWN